MSPAAPVDDCCVKDSDLQPQPDETVGASAPCVLKSQIVQPPDCASNLYTYTGLGKLFSRVLEALNVYIFIAHFYTINNI